MRSKTKKRRSPTRWAIAVTALIATPALAAPTSAAPVACPSTPTRVVRSSGGNNDYNGTVPGIPQLCRMIRPDGHGDYYFGIWRTDWPGAGDAFPAMSAIFAGPAGTRAEFITRSVPGWQWKDTFINEGQETLVIAGHAYTTTRIAHEREGIEGNTYHSIITTWHDIATGIGLKTVENQISGQSYGPATTWTATNVETLR
jgi:hypothetical protein